MDEEARQEFLEEMKFEGMMEEARIAFEKEQKQMAYNAWLDEKLEAMDIEEIDEDGN